MIYRKMTLKERIFGRTPDTSEVIVYKNRTLAEWFFGRDEDKWMRIMTAIQRSVAIIAGIIALWLLT